VFAGSDQVIAFLRSYKFSETDVEYLRQMPSLKDCDPAFFKYLLTIDCSGIVVSAAKEGSIVFPRVTLISVQQMLSAQGAFLG
jgi:nicotinate phosphoribosyltransferase